MELLRKTQKHMKVEDAVLAKEMKGKKKKRRWNTHSFSQLQGFSEPN